MRENEKLDGIEIQYGYTVYSFRHVPMDTVFDSIVNSCILSKRLMLKNVNEAVNNV